MSALRRCSATATSGALKSIIGVENVRHGEQASLFAALQSSLLTTRRTAGRE